MGIVGLTWKVKILKDEWRPRGWCPPEGDLGESGVLGTGATAPHSSLRYRHKVQSSQEAMWMNCYFHFWVWCGSTGDSGSQGEFKILQEKIYLFASHIGALNASNLFFFAFPQSQLAILGCSLGDGVDMGPELKQWTISVIHPVSRLLNRCVLRANYLSGEYVEKR